MQTSKLMLLLLIASLEGRAQTSSLSGSTETRADRSDSGGVRPRDYTQWERKLSLAEVRGGSYEESGVVKYYFKATLYGVLDTAEEAGIGLDKRRKVALELGTFGDIKIKSLDLVKIGEKSPPGMELNLTGDQIRGLVAKSMLELGAKEWDVGVVLELQMLRRSKKYWVMGQDTLVAVTSIPWGGQSGGPPQGDDLSLIRLEDEKGAHAVLKVITKTSKAGPA